jgi:NAD-dependent DNA ligase
MVRLISGGIFFFWLMSLLGPPTYIRLPVGHTGVSILALAQKIANIPKSIAQASELASCVVRGEIICTYEQAALLSTPNSPVSANLRNIANGLVHRLSDSEAHKALSIVAYHAHVHAQHSSTVKSKRDLLVVLQRHGFQIPLNYYVSTSSQLGTRLVLNTIPMTLN